jgi:hypothetical protein
MTDQPAKKARKPSARNRTVTKATPVKRKRPGAQKYPWEQVREHYISAESVITLKDLAEVYTIPYQTVRERAADERWTYLRSEHQVKNAIAVREARTVHLAKESVSFDDTSLRAAKLGQTLIAGRLGQIAALFQASGKNFDATLAKLRAGQPVDLGDLRSVINYKELGELAAALDRFQAVGRKAMGTDVEKIELSGPGGDAIQVSVHDEMQKPDLDRMAAAMEAMHRSGLSDIFSKQLGIDMTETAEVVEATDENGDAVDAELVEDS